MRFQGRAGSAVSPPRYALFQALTAELKRSVLTARATHFKDGLFFANGGAVWFEAERPAGGGGLVEGSTPECRGPLRLLQYQRAQDRLLAECAEQSEMDSRFTLIKNDRDAWDNVYGAQENYEAILARGWRLGLWRLGLILLIPLVLLTWLGFGLMIVGILVYLAAAGMVFLPLQLLFPRHRKLALWLFGRDLVQGRETGSPTPPWLESILLWVTRIVTAPLAVSLLVLLHVTAFQTQRRQLVPFLVSRAVFSGAGMVARDGGFQLADKAPAINCVLGLGGFLKDRPIFTFGHFFKTICAESCFAPSAFFELFGRWQRMQIGLGDSNMAESAEYLRIGTTALVLDVIEAGEMPRLPPLRRPVKALHSFCRDVTLQESIELKSGGSWTAIRLQRFYLEACQQFLARRPNAPLEAHDIVTRWREVLDGLDERVLSGRTPDWMIGSIDWVTKEYLLDEAGPNASWSKLKKIDISYHELAETGYFELLRSAGLVECLVNEPDIQRAFRTPPPDSPATMRGHFMREFTEDGVELSVNWRQVTMGRGWGAKVIRLARYRSSFRRPDQRPRQPAAQ